ncbi:MAG: hypothetical protein ACK5LY_04745 [Lachnospirales bacterium]
MASLQNIEKSILKSEFSLRENDFVALVRRVLYKTMALRLLTNTCKFNFFFCDVPFIEFYNVAN